MAETDEDLQAVAELVAEHELRQGSGATSAPAPSKDRWIVPTLGDVAAFLGVEVSTIWGWRTGANKMPGDEGHWDLQAITRWRCERLGRLSANAKSPEQTEVELDILKEDRLKRQLANRLKAKELVSREVVLAKVAEMFNEARMLIEAIPADVGPLMPPEIRNELTVKIGQMFALSLRKMAQKAKGCVE